MQFTIIKQRPLETEDREYKVMENDLLCMEHLSYTQCLTYIGARLLGKSHVTAKGFALGIYI